ncbi:uncharacterized protein LOC143595798 [Bidens hawaiensis]|uniref:uncharacterized protein LOC143595798 n=1 Tax=Bidens hawaiensis TaxID=980011 RepID=UPI00404965A7
MIADVSACEETWRIFAFDLPYRLPSVMRLAFHLPGEQQVIHGANEDIEDILNKTTNASSLFTGWYECNKKYDSAKRLTYSEFPTKFVWKKQGRKWEPQLRVFAVDRVHVVPPAFDEAYYLRILLNKVKGKYRRLRIIEKDNLNYLDEALMIHKYAFKALDRTLNDVMTGDSANTSESLFGGKVVVFGGDFRQIFPVETNGTRSECVNACINSSYIWSKCKVLKLTKNMRLTVGCRSSDVENIKEFADWLLNIGEGNVGGPNDGESDRALLAPLNEVVQEINERMLALFPGEEVEYLSSDSLAECENVSDDFNPQLYSPDLLIGLKMSEIHNHILVLKVCVPIMLLRNIVVQLYSPPSR